MKPMFSPSLMCMDLLKIREQIQVLNLHADFYHIDIMDGHFVKNITLSPDFVKAVARVSRVPLDCHLMVTHPDDSCPGRSHLSFAACRNHQHGCLSYSS